jgi:hypothetical protein
VDDLFIELEAARDELAKKVKAGSHGK